MHEVVLSKEGYHTYSLPFIGPVTGAKRIDAVLTKNESENVQQEKDSSSTESIEDEEEKNETV